MAFGDRTVGGYLTPCVLKIRDLLLPNRRQGPAHLRRRLSLESVKYCPNKEHQIIDPEHGMMMLSMTLTGAGIYKTALRTAKEPKHRACEQEKAEKIPADGHGM